MKMIRSNFTTSDVSDAVAITWSTDASPMNLAAQLNPQWLSLMDYESALQAQSRSWNSARAAILRNEISASILGLEHPAVVTLGSRGQADQDLKAKIPFVRTDRGGQATLHSPGQLVIYPILALQQWKLGVREFVEILQTTTQALLQQYGIESRVAAGAGLQTAHGKIAFIGLRVERGVTRHGLSLNVRNDLGLFSQIRSCGVETASLDRMIDRATDPTQIPPLEQLFTEWLRHFALVLGKSGAAQNPGLQ